MSLLPIFPSVPELSTSLRSIPFSSAIFLAKGEALILSSSEELLLSLAVSLGSAFSSASSLSEEELSSAFSVSSSESVVDRKSTRLNSSHVAISYAVFCLKKKTHTETSNQYLSAVKLHLT